MEVSRDWYSVLWDKMEAAREYAGQSSSPLSQMVSGELVSAPRRKTYWYPSSGFCVTVPLLRVELAISGLELQRGG